MNGPEVLAQYKRQIDADIAAYSESLLTAAAQDFGPYSRQAMQACLALLAAGGKRVRGALVMVSYQKFGGNNLQLALQAARAVELLHVSMLMLDDICDRSLTRRGIPSVHTALQAQHQQHHLQGDSAHFGESVTLGLSVVATHLALQQLTQLPVDPKRLVQALDIVHHTFTATGYGQVNDIYNQALQTVDEAQVLRTLTLKTAYYSFLGPLRLGAALAGHAEVSQLTDYATNLGLAFQITDDIIGTFGNEHASGKSTTDDLKEGKITLLVAYALAHAAPDDAQILRQTLGDAHASAQSLQVCKEIIKKSGALAYAQDKAASYAAKAHHALRQAPEGWPDDLLAFLAWLADYVTSRKS